MWTLKPEMEKLDSDRSMDGSDNPQLEKRFTNRLGDEITKVYEWLDYDTHLCDFRQLT